ncbi:MAG: RNA polymerase sigma-70 factor [Bacteroidetes bacterium]|nr:RNA polymerase sigma-70 factor [Bacteroidota bacterium]MBT6687295.1 RNA polymerase sigma-70 factor [Bacteroidota bacterium]MBT7143959.1 RNA polymerase sigma-70 factor [Bacteroidota bacterium]MBT7491128.1 RNA polymerase sigma-70 factor [Bacteroidota bacterium]
MKTSEKFILNKIKLGEEEYFEQVFKMYYFALCLYSKKFVKSYEIAEEITQDVFMKLWEKREQIEITTSLKAYLFKATHNFSINFLNHEKIENKYKSFHFNVLKELELNPPDNYYEPELEKKIQNAIDSLPKKCREIFEQSRFEFLKYNEIAEKRGISVKTVEAQISKALKILRKKLNR